VTGAPASRLGRARAIGAALVAIAVALLVAALAPGCDRLVNLTPFYDAQPALDAPPADGSFGLDVGLHDGTGAPGDGSAAPDDGSVFPDDGGALPDDGSVLPDDAR